MALKTVAIDKIKVNYNPRKDFGKVDDIAKSIESVGLLLPLAVREDKDGTLWLVDGEQRLRALKKLEQKEVAVNVLTLDDQQTKEAQMVANLMRSDLTFMERARGFIHLLNDKAKYNEAVIAKKFGFKEKQVKDMVRVVKNIDEKCDALISDPQCQWDSEDLEVLAQVPKDKQILVLKEGGSALQALQEVAFPLQNTYGEVFKVEGLVSSGKAFMVKLSHTKVAFTFDKEVFEQAKREWEQANKAKNKTETYEGAEKGRQEKAKGDEEAQKAQAKKEREAAKKRYEKGIASIGTCLQKFIESKPTKDTCEKLSSEYLRRLSADDCKAILRAFKIEFKASELGSEELRGLVWEKVLKAWVKTEANVVQLWALTHAERTKDMKLDPVLWAKELEG